MWSIVAFTFIHTFDQNFVFFTERRHVDRQCVSGLKDEKLIKRKQTYTKTEAYKLYSRVFSIFLPNVIKIDPYNFELYRYKIYAFFETQLQNAGFCKSTVIHDQCALIPSRIWVIPSLKHFVSHSDSNSHDWLNFCPIPMVIFNVKH